MDLAALLSVSEQAQDEGALSHVLREGGEQ
jgi:hypothetical protein